LFAIAYIIILRIYTKFHLVGFGLSEKINDITIHTPEFHATLFVKLIEALDLRNFTIVGQDWGGPIAALVAARLKDRQDLLLKF